MFSSKRTTVDVGGKLKILDLAVAGSRGLARCDAIVAGTAHLPNDPTSAGLMRMKALAKESLSVFSRETLEVRKRPHVFSHSSGTIEFPPVQKALRSVTAMSVPCPPPRDKHQGDVSLGTIEAKSYAIEFFKEYTNDGR